MAAIPGGPRVLVVDDTDDVRMLIRRTLAAHGYQVDEAASLAQARQLDPVRYDVVLVDAHLGAELGTDLIEALLARDPAAVGRCMMITGGSSGAPPGVPVLGKPFRVAELLHAVRALHQPEPAPADPQPAPADREPGPADPHPASADPQPAPAGPQPAPAGTVPVAPTAGPSHAQPATAGPGNHLARMPPAWRLLALIRGLRASERATLADFVHDGPIQELAAASLALQAPGSERAGVIGELQDNLDAAGRSLRFITDGDWAFLPPGATLADTIRQRTAWLPLSSVTVDIRQTCAALRAEALLIADVVELALFVMTSDGPLSQAHVCVQAGETEAEIVLTLTQPGDVRDWGADPGQLAELASILGGTTHADRDPARWQVRITLPRQCAVDRRAGHR